MNTFLIADTKFTYYGIAHDLHRKGTKGRPFDSTKEMNDALISNWNSVVKSQDIVYHLGDVTCDEGSLEVIDALNGTKYLIQGDKDSLFPTKYLKYFERVEPSVCIDDILLSHVPVHSCMFNKYKANIHGQLKHCTIKKPFSNKEDARYLCVSVEQIGYTPISLEDAKLKLLNR
jgi:calcineurin-like phosphoesterase family protein